MFKNHSYVTPFYIHYKVLKNLICENYLEILFHFHCKIIHSKSHTPSFSAESPDSNHVSSSSKCTSPPLPVSGKKACARILPGPSNGYPSP